MRGVARVLKVMEQGIVLKYCAKKVYVMCSSSRKLIQKEGLQGLNKSLLENNGITLGKWGWVCPKLVVPQMDHFMQPWCYVFCM